MMQFWLSSDRITYSWITSSQAAWLLGLASVLVSCSWPVLFLIDPSKHANDGILLRCGWALFGVAGALSSFFVMGAMKKYRELREFRSAGTKRSKFVSVLLFVGVWWAAVVYYLLVYLPERRGSLKTESFGEHVS